MLKIDPSIFPGFIQDLIRSVMTLLQQGCQNAGFYIFRASVWLRLLHLIQSIEDKSCLDKLQKDACCALNILDDVFSRPMIQEVMNNPVECVIQQAKLLKPIIQEIEELSLVCNISLWSALQLHEAFLQLLKNPLIAMTAHVYTYLRLSNCVDSIPQLESFCNKHPDLLFWVGRRPLNLHDWKTSYEKWVTPTDSNVQRIARLRTKRSWSNSLWRELAQNNFKLTTDLKQKSNIESTGNVFDGMRSELERGIPSDTVGLYDTVSRVIRAILAEETGLKVSADISDVNLAHFVYRYIDRIAKPFISQLATTMPLFA